MNVSLRHTLREGNHCADFFAKLGEGADARLLLHSSPPDDLRPLLRNDATGTLFLRAQSLLFLLFLFSVCQLCNQKKTRLIHSLFIPKIVGKERVFKLQPFQILICIQEQLDVHVHSYITCVQKKKLHCMLLPVDQKQNKQEKTIHKRLFQSLSSIIGQGVSGSFQLDAFNKREETIYCCHITFHIRCNQISMYLTEFRMSNVKGYATLITQK